VSFLLAATLAPSSSYRYGFNGKENDKDIKGDGNSYDFGARIYDPRLGRWLSVDPLQEKYPFSSPYAYSLNSPIKCTDPDGRYTIGEKTTSLTSFLTTLNSWGVEAIKYKQVTFVGKADIPVYESENHCKMRIFDSDFRSTNQSIKQVGGKDFSYNKSFGKYLDVGLPLDVAHFFKCASLAQDLPDFAVRKAYVHEEYKQSKDCRDGGRTSAFAPEDLFSNELGVIFGDKYQNKGDFNKNFEGFMSEVKTLFTTNTLENGKYLTSSNVKDLRALAKEYYGTEDLTTFNKKSSIYKVENIKTINNNALNDNKPFYNNTNNSPAPTPDQLDCDK
jgi:RHS repeat-associated protein